MCLSRVCEQGRGGLRMERWAEGAPSSRLSRNSIRTNAADDGQSCDTLVLFLTVFITLLMYYFGFFFLMFIYLS